MVMFLSGVKTASTRIIIQSRLDSIQLIQPQIIIKFFGGGTGIQKPVTVDRRFVTCFTIVLKTCIGGFAWPGLLPIQVHLYPIQHLLHIRRFLQPLSQFQYRFHLRQYLPAQQPRLHSRSLPQLQVLAREAKPSPSTCPACLPERNR